MLRRRQLKLSLDWEGSNIDDLNLTLTETVLVLTMLVFISDWKQFNTDSAGKVDWKSRQFGEDSQLGQKRSSNGRKNSLHFQRAEGLHKTKNSLYGSKQLRYPSSGYPTWRQMSHSHWMIDSSHGVTHNIFYVLQNSDSFQKLQWWGWWGEGLFLKKWRKPSWMKGDNGLQQGWLERLTFPQVFHSL